MTKKSNLKKKKYLGDSGANAHIVVDDTMVQNLIDWEQQIKVGGRTMLTSTKKSDLAIQTESGPIIGLMDVLVVPNFGKNIISIGAFVAKGAEFVVKKDQATLRVGGTTVTLKKEGDGMFYITGKPVGMKIEK